MKWFLLAHLVRDGLGVLVFFCESKAKSAQLAIVRCFLPIINSVAPLSNALTHELRLRKKVYCLVLTVTHVVCYTIHLQILGNKRMEISTEPL